MSECPVCGLDIDTVEVSDRGEKTTCNCRRCGRFTITSIASAKVDGNSRFKLSAWIRDKTERCVEAPEITSGNFEQVVDSFREYTVTEKQKLFLKFLSSKSKYPGDKIAFNAEYDFPVVWARGIDEFGYLYRSLLERNLVKRVNDGKASIITSHGWDILDGMDGSLMKTVQVFVAMSFDADLKCAWEKGIKPAVENAGYRPYRVDKDSHNERIDAKIITEIDNSCFLVADVTKQKNGVYFEAGYAQGKKLPVLWSVRKNDLKNVHFDTRQFAHIVWDSPEDLKEQLYTLICAVVGKRKN
jgi:hypothetical protein